MASETVAALVDIGIGGGVLALGVAACSLGGVVWFWLRGAARREEQTARREEQAARRRAGARQRTLRFYLRRVAHQHGGWVSVETAVQTLGERPRVMQETLAALYVQGFCDEIAMTEAGDDLTYHFPGR